MECAGCERKNCESCRKVQHGEVLRTTLEKQNVCLGFSFTAKWQYNTVIIIISERWSDIMSDQPKIWSDTI